MKEINSLRIFGFNNHFKVSGLSQASNLIPKIDINYKFNQEITSAILAGFQYNKNVMLTGLHGTGKSTHIEQVAARLNWPTIRINLDGSINRSELVGRETIILKEGKQITEFAEGVLPWAIRNGCALILDEYDAARPEVLFVLQRILETDGKFSLLESNLILTPHENFRLFATANTAGIGDNTSLYHGTQFLNQGQLDRWNIIARLDYIKPEDEIIIIHAKVPSVGKELIKQMVNFATLTRDGFKIGVTSNLMSPRTVLNWAENYKIFNSITKSLELSFLNKCAAEELEIYAEYYQRIFDSELLLS